MTQAARRRALLAVAALGVAGLVSLHAQTPVSSGSSPAFEVASVKRNNSGDGNITRGMQPGGRLTFINNPLRQLIIAAYQVQPFQVIGGPSWLTTDRFDIVAKAPDGATPDQMNPMLRTLLAERFKLVVHRETREMPVYSLVKARPDGRLGDRLKPAAVDCGPAARGRGGPPPTPPGGAPGAAPGPQGPLMGCRAMISPGRLQIAGQPLAQLASLLANQVGRPIVDKTGLAGAYDIELSFMPEGAGRGGPVGTPPPGAPPIPAVDPDAPSLFTALQEQLGLKLESERGPVEVVVIDSVEQPVGD